MQSNNLSTKNTCTGMGAQPTIKYAAIDFETTYHKSQVDIGSLGVWHYLRHPRCTIYMVSVYTEGGTFVGHPADFDFESIHNCEWVSHNAAFDQEVYIRLQELGLAPDWMPRKWHCSANMTAFFGASERNLADAARVHLGLDLSKDVRDAMNKKTWDDIRKDEPFHEEVKQYALRDAEVCYQLWMAKKDEWPAREQELSALTMLQVRRGLPCDQDYLDESIKALSVAAFEAVHRLPWAEGDEEKALSDLLFAAECRKLGIVPHRSKAKGSIEALDWEEQHPHINWIADRRTYLRANLLRTKLLTMKDRIRDDGRIHFGTKYFGAHTGRWSGDTKLNVQGLTKETLHGANQRRVVCVQDPSKKLIIADLSQIEPRVLAWVVGDWDFLNLCRTVSVYEAHARQTLGWTGGVLKKENPSLYQLAKARCLHGTTPILTERGYMTVSELQKNSCLRVWDGVAWVRYEEVIQTGEKPVRMFQGEFLTDDHEIFLQDGRTVPVGEVHEGAKRAQLLRRNPPCGEWGDVWKLACFVARSLTEEWVSLLTGRMRRMRGLSRERLEQPS